MEFKSIILFNILCVCVSGFKNNSYYIDVPPDLHREVDINIVVSVFQTKSPVIVTTSFTDEILVFTNQTLVNSNFSRLITIGQIPLEYVETQPFKLTVSGVDSATGENLFKKNYDQFKLESKKLFIFAQLDKVHYKNEELVRFRAVFLLPNLQPYNGNVQYTLQQYRNQHYRQDVQAVNGLVVGQIRVPRFVRQNLRIRFEALGQQKEVRLVQSFRNNIFTFKVFIEGPKYFKASNKDITVKLTAYDLDSYPARGEASIDIYPLRLPKPENYYEKYAYPNKKKSPKRKFQAKLYSNMIKNYHGEFVFTITKEQAMKGFLWDGKTDVELRISGSVGSNYKKKEVSLKSKSTPTTIEFLDDPKTNIPDTGPYDFSILKPGLMYNYRIKVIGSTTQLLNVEVEHRVIIYRQKEIAEVENYVYNIPEDGIVNFNFTVKKTDKLKYNLITIKASTNTSDGIVSSQIKMNVAEEESNSYMNLKPSINSSNIIGQFAEINIDTTDPIQSFRVVLISRDSIIKQEQVNRFDQPANTHQKYRFLITKNMIPEVGIKVVYFKEDGTPVSSDFKYIIYTGSLIEISVQRPNGAPITNAYEYDVVAGELVQVKVKTPYSDCYVGVRVLDQNIQSSFFRRNDFSEVETRGIFNHEYPYRLTEELQLSILSDLPSYNLDYNKRVHAERETRYLNHTFPPITWLWDSATTDSNGVAVFNATVPNENIAWIWNVFTYCGQHDFQYKDFKMNAKREIFSQFEVASNIIMGEIVFIKVVIFNGLNHNVKVNIFLHENNNIEILNPENTNKTVTILANQIDSVIFPISIKKLGKIKIAATTSSKYGINTISKSLISVDRGFKQCYSTSVLHENISNNNSENTNVLSAYLPPNVISNATSVQYNIYGDIMEPTIRNLGNLIDLSTDNGVGNLINILPDIFCALYLQKIGKLNEKFKKRVLKNVNTAYLKELSYEKQHGGYIAINEFEDSFASVEFRIDGSISLTAFVLKTLNFMKKFLPADRGQTIDNAFSFLESQLQSNGTYYTGKQGFVAPKGFTNLESGPHKDIRLAAFVIIAELETEPFQIYFCEAYEAHLYVESQLDSILDDKYSLAIVSYALQVSNCSKKSVALSALEKLATIEGDMMYWQEENNKDNHVESSFLMPSSLDIETTSYALLTYVWRKDINKVVPITKWLVSKRSKKGGFRGVQDTIIAIQALSESAAFIYKRNQNQTKDLNVTASYVGGQDHSVISNVDGVKLNTTKAVELPPQNGNIIVNTQGSGLAVSQLNVCYNIPETSVKTEIFNCSVDVNTKKYKYNETVFVNVCCSLNPGQNAIGIFYIRVNYLSGFSTDYESLKRRQRNVRKGPRVIYAKIRSFKLDDRGVNIFYNEVKPGQELCVNIPMLRKELVLNIQPQTVTALDYLNPSRKFEQMYNINELDEASLCKTCGYKCNGCPAPIEDNWSSWTPCSEFCKPEVSTRTRYCIDPSTGKKLILEICGLNQLKVEVRSCPPAGFPCPVTHDGLYKILHYKVNPSYSCNSACGTNRELGRFFSAYFTGSEIPNFTPNSLPGTYTDDVTLNITCQSALAGRQQKELRPSGRGLTVSILINIERLQQNTSFNLFYFGQSFDFATFDIPSYGFRKTRSDSFIFQVIFRNERYETELPSSVLVDGRWKHLIITWHHRFGVSIYVNGLLIETTTQKDSNDILPIAQFFRNFKYSRQKLLHRTEFFTMKGFENSEIAYSSFSIWNYRLKVAEINALAAFYYPVIIETDPLLSVRMIHQFLCPRFNKCFTKPARFSDFSKIDNIPFTDLC